MAAAAKVTMDAVNKTDYNLRMSGFTKLFESIIHSTVWATDMHVKITWVTMLAMANRKGQVCASVPGLAKAAGVTLEQAVDALTVLSSPDKWSRTKAHEGRRIAEIDGGWQLLNYQKYRDQRDAGERRVQVREAVARHRAKGQSDVINVINVSRSKPLKAQAEAEAEAEAEKIKSPIATRSVIDDGFGDCWQAYPRKVGKAAALKAWRKQQPDRATVLEALQWQRTQPQWVKDNGEFVPHMATWLNRRGWDDEPPTVRVRASLGTWRDECQRLHAGQCGNQHFHAAKMAAAS